MAGSTVLTNLRLVDLDVGRAEEGAWLRIDDGRIAGFGLGDAPAGDARIEDLGGAFLLPGLWDVHAHMSFERPVPRNETTAQRTLRCIQAAVGAARAGITGIRSAGEAEFIDCAAKEFFQSSSVRGPRVVPAGYFLTTTGGHITDNPVALALDGPVAFRKAVRDNIRHGAEVIKINMSGGIWGPAWDTIEDVFHADDELAAVFETAQQRGLPVMAHAAGARSAKLAVKWGARSIEHGYALDEEAIESMARAGTVFVPTLAMSQLSAGLAHDEHERRFLGGYEIPPAILQKALGVAERAEWGFREALKAGIKIACGSDTNPLAEGAKLELAWLVRFGMSPREALLAATKTAAELCGYGDETGTIATGKAADLLAVDGDPLADVYAIRRVRGVWRQGVRVT
jgi:imidazolonepropionase-like amidohydrolase